TEARARAKLGLDRPVFEQYVRFLGRLAHGDFGVSYAYPGTPVRRMVAEALGPSALLGGLAVGGAVLLRLPLALPPPPPAGSVLDRLVRLVPLSGIAVPFFVIAIGLVLVFSLRLRWLPVSGWGTPAHLALPVVVLALRPLAYVARITRLAMLQVLQEDYVR